MGGDAVRGREGRRHPREHQPGVSAARAGIRARPVRRVRAHRGARVPQRRTTSRCCSARAGVGSDAAGGRSRPNGCRRCASVVYLGTDAQPGGMAWPDFLDARRCARGERPRRRAKPRCSSTIRSTSSTPPGTTGSPKGATLSHHNILNNGYFVGEALRYTEHDRICLPVPFYHCFGCVLGNLAARDARQRHCHSRRIVRCRRYAARDRGARLHVDLRRADDVHRAARSSALQQLPARFAAHGHHGRRAVSRSKSCARSSTGCTCRRSRSATA